MIPQDLLELILNTKPGVSSVAQKTKGASYIENKDLDEMWVHGKIYHFNILFLFQVPSAPSSLKIVNPTLDSLTLEWDPPSHPNGILTEYTLKFQPSKLLGEGEEKI